MRTNHAFHVCWATAASVIAVACIVEAAMGGAPASRLLACIGTLSGMLCGWHIADFLRSLLRRRKQAPTSSQQPPNKLP